MFGLFRYLLAVMVVVGHLVPTLVPNMGSYAVFAFYVLSGYLITLVLTDSYGFSLSGTYRFLLNRSLRIYPPYIVSVILALTVLLLYPELPSHFSLIIRMPESTIEWIKNIFIFGLEAGFKPDHMLIGVAWSLYVELIFYIAMALMLVRHKYITVIWFLLSIIVTSIMVIKGDHFYDRYYSILGGSLPFSTGAMIYLFRDKLKVNSKLILFLSIPFYLVNLVLTRYLDIKYMFTPGIYISFFLAAAILIGCMNLDKEHLPKWYKSTDKLLGDLSYPIYLIHWPVAILVSLIFFSGNLQRTSELLYYSVIPINLVALVIYYLIERKINNIRSNVKERAISSKEMPPLLCIEK